MESKTMKTDTHYQAHELGDDSDQDDTYGGLMVAALALLVSLACVYLLLAWLAKTVLAS
jgi:hypothetical protein